MELKKVETKPCTVEKVRALLNPLNQKCCFEFGQHRMQIRDYVIKNEIKSALRSSKYRKQWKSTKVAWIAFDD